MRIVMIGAGNVASSLAPALSAADGIELVQVFSRTLAHAVELAQKSGCKSAVDSLDSLDRSADVYVVCVPDNAISDVVENTSHIAPQALWLHTSGTTPLGVLLPGRKRCGVLYPLQTFSRALPMDISQVPLLVEGNTAESEAQVMRLARALSCRVTAVTSEKRERLHAAAVFACNFANHCCTLASEVMDDAGLDFNLLLPLVRTTVDKLSMLTPAESQTGPAARRDTRTIERHLAMLDGDKKEIYNLLTGSIIRRRT